jgi:putative acetyltransferase
MLQIKLESPNQVDVLKLIDDLDLYQKPLYPAESHHGIDIDALLKPNVLFAVARDVNGTALACGAIVIEPSDLSRPEASNSPASYGELKRMYTVPAARGQGIAKALLGFLESQATLQGTNRFALETGNLQPEAIGLYQKCGYVLCGPFGDYKEDPNSVFMRKGF